MRLTGGLRVDGYRVTTEATPGYDGRRRSSTAPCRPIDPATLPDVNGETISRTAVTGEAGVVALVGAAGELLRVTTCAATAIRISRNCSSPVRRRPATSCPTSRSSRRPDTTWTSGARCPHVPASSDRSAYFNNTYDNFISTEIVATVGSSRASIRFRRRSISRSVRIQGVEVEGNAPFGVGLLNWLPYGNASLQPRDGASRHESAVRVSRSTASRRTTSRRGRSRRPARERPAGALVGRLQRAHADRRHARVAAARRVAVPHRAGSARPRRIHGPSRRRRLRLAARRSAPRRSSPPSTT